MRLLLRSILAPILNERNKKKLKKIEFKFKKRIINLLPRLDEDKFRKVLVEDLGLKKGDNVFIHASLSLVNTSLKSADIVRILQDIIGEKGSISVPCFPAMSSKKYMLSKNKFDINSTRSGMGEFSEYVRRLPGAVRSFHPVKSIASIGLPQGILDNHNESEFPFGWGSPYPKLLDLDIKVIGIGVPMSYLSFVHVAEDMNYDRYPLKVYESERLTKICYNSSGEECAISSFVHDMNIVVKANPERYVREYLDAKFWSRKQWYLSPFFVVDAKALTKSISSNIDKNKTVYY